MKIPWDYSRDIINVFLKMFFLSENKRGSLLRPTEGDDKIIIKESANKRGGILAYVKERVLVIIGSQSSTTETRGLYDEKNVESELYNHYYWPGDFSFCQ